MKRRNFLKAMVGISAVPTTSCLARSSFNRNTFYHHSSTLINHDNIKINGTFEEWIKSIEKETERLLATKSKELDADWFKPYYNVKTESCDWSPKQDGSMPAFMIQVYVGSYGLMVSFSFAKCEWDRNCKSPKALQSMLNIRFIDFVWSVYHAVREQVILLKGLDIDCSKSLNEYGAI